MLKGEAIKRTLWLVRVEGLGCSSRVRTKNGGRAPKGKWGSENKATESVAATRSILLQL